MNSVKFRKDNTKFDRYTKSEDIKNGWPCFVIWKTL